jgi:hypothetical protein
MPAARRENKALHRQKFVIGLNRHSLGNEIARSERKDNENRDLTSEEVGSHDGVDAESMAQNWCRPIDNQIN